MGDYQAARHEDAHRAPTRAGAAPGARLSAARGRLAAAEQNLARIIDGAAGIAGAAAANKAIPAARKKITTEQQATAKAEDALKQIPAKLPANQLTPGAQKAILATRRRSPPLVLRLLAHAAEHWTATRLNDYLRDNDEYRAVTRNLLHLGGTITYQPAAITVTLDRPATPRLSRAPALLLDQINAAPPRMPGDPRPISYQLTPPPV